MMRDSRFQSWLLAVLCVAMLAGRVGGAHLHLCFDGEESAKALHWMDSGIHHPGEAGMVLPHQDADVAVIGELIAKSDKLAADLPLFLVALLLPWLLLQAPRFSPPLRTHLVPFAPLFLRPPLRGPPVSSLTF